MRSDKLKAKRLRAAGLGGSLLLGLSLAVVWAHPWRSEAQQAFPLVIPYEGDLSLDGTPVDGSMDMRFHLFNSSGEGGEPLWSEERLQSTGRAVQVYAGRFEVWLGQYQPLSEVIGPDQTLYLNIEVSQPGADDWVALAGRQAVLAQPWAFWSTRSDEFVARGAVTAAALNAENIQYFGSVNPTLGNTSIGADLYTSHIDNPAMVQPGTIWYFDLTACPTGWSEVTAARGRFLVGSFSSDVGYTSGTALTNVENRAHTHNFNPTSVTTNITGSHDHTFNAPDTATGTALGSYDTSDWIGANRNNNFAIPDHTHSYDPGPQDSSTDGNHSHTLNISNFASGSASISQEMPYIQLLLCQMDAP
ncbi:MAG: hypothetical protein KC561_18290 [Myxococcales bacterium]|nr:hypothetical protein [Myxococcales bacterium]